MEQINGIFSTYLSTALAWTAAELEAVRRAVGGTRDPDLGRLINLHREGGETRLAVLRELAEKASPQGYPSLKPEFIMEPTSEFDGEAATPHEEALGFISNILQNEQLQIGLIIGIAEIARKKGALQESERLLNMFNEMVRDLEELQHFLPVLTRSAYASSELSGSEEVITEGWESSFGEFQEPSRKKRTRNDLFVSYAKKALISETRTAGAVEMMAKTTEDAIHLNFLLASSGLIAEKLDRLGTLLRRHGADVPAVESTPISRSDTLNDALNLLTAGHREMAEYATLISLARSFPNEYSANLLMANLSGTIRLVEKAYAALPHALGEAFAKPPSWEAA